MPRFETIELGEFEGLNENENPHTLRRGELVRAENIGRLGDSIGTRPGTLRDTDVYTSDITGTVPVAGLFELRTDFDANRKLAAVAGTGVWEDPSTDNVGASGVTVTSGANNVWTFAEHANKLYGVGGDDGDDPWSWTGSGDIVAVTITSTTNPKTIWSQWNFGFVTGMSGTDAHDNEMVIRYSQLGNLDVWPISNTIGGSSFIGGFSSYGGEYLTGCANHTDNTGDWLLGLSNRRIYLIAQTADWLAPFAIQGTVANGCVHQNAFVPLGVDSGDAIYLSERGIHSLRQSRQFGSREDRFLSWKVRKTFRELNPDRLRYSSGAYWRSEGLVLFLLTEGTGSTHNVILALDIKDQEEITADNARWYKWTLTGETPTVIRAVRNATFDPLEGDDGVYLGTSNGKVIRFTRSAYDDLGSGYVVDFQTAHDDVGVPGVDKGLGDISMNLQPGGTYTPNLTAIFDFGRRATVTQSFDMIAQPDPVWGGFTWGGANWPADESKTIRERLYGVGAGDTISWRFTHAGTNQPFRIARFTYGARLIGNSREDLATNTG